MPASTPKRPAGPASTPKRPAGPASTIEPPASQRIDARIAALPD